MGNSDLQDTVVIVTGVHQGGRVGALLVGAALAIGHGVRPLGHMVSGSLLYKCTLTCSGH